MAYSPVEDKFLSALTAVQFPSEPVEPEMPQSEQLPEPVQVAQASGGLPAGSIKAIEPTRFERALQATGLTLEQAGRFLDSLGQVDVPVLGKISLADFVPFVGSAKEGSRSVLGSSEWQGTPMAMQQAGTGQSLTRGTGMARQLTPDASLALMDVATNIVPVGKVVAKGGKALAMETGQQLNRAILEGTGPLASVVPRSARPKFIVEPIQAMQTNVQVKMPSDPVFAEAVSNTPGAQITEDGLLMNVVRFQKPEQEGAQAIRTGVFYLPSGSANTRHYKTGATGYGGTEKFEGQTLIRSPLFVKGATGGKAPEAAYDAIKGKGAMKALDKAVMDTVTSRGWMNKMEDGLFEEKVQQFLTDNGGNPDLAWEIIQNSKKGNQLRYALQENIIAHTVREAGYDAVVGYSKGKAGASISEVFDVREQTFPARGMESQIHDAFTQ